MCGWLRAWLCGWLRGCCGLCPALPSAALLGPLASVHAAAACAGAPHPSRTRPALLPRRAGNFADGRKTFKEINYDDPKQFEEEREYIRWVGGAGWGWGLLGVLWRGRGLGDNGREQGGIGAGAGAPRAPCLAAAGSWQLAATAAFVAPAHAALPLPLPRPPPPHPRSEVFSPLVEKCKSLNRAMRIGTNHGSLSARILSYYGAPPCSGAGGRGQGAWGGVLVPCSGQRGGVPGARGGGGGGAQPLRLPSVCWHLGQCHPLLLSLPHCAAAAARRRHPPRHGGERV